MDAGGEVVAGERILIAARISDWIRKMNCPTLAPWMKLTALPPFAR